MRALYHRLRNHPELQKRPAVTQFARFVVVGTSNTIIDFTIYTILTRLVGLHFLIANTCSFIVAVTWSYVINRIWTFRNRSANVSSQFIKFIVVSLSALALVTILLATFHRGLGINDLIAKALAIGIVMFWNYFLNRHWTFKTI